jgi:hypothetical protein
MLACPSNALRHGVLRSRGTPVRGVGGAKESGATRTSENSVKAKFVFWVFSEIQMPLLRACADRLATFHTCRFSERLSGFFITH